LRTSRPNFAKNVSWQASRRRTRPAARDDRPWGGADPPAVAFTYAPGRGAVHALKLLDRYRGIVQCDGYQAYKTVANAACDDAVAVPR
jgi:transposase